MTDKVTETFTVRGRPVGYAANPWGGAFVAVERGYFPISPTGFWSSSGFARREDISAEAKAAVLEKLAEDRDRERTELIHRLREAATPEGNSIINYIHASGAYEKAVQDGFFATDKQRAELWAGAYPLLCLVDTDRRFQPQPEPGYVAWTEAGCAEALARAREMRALLTRLAAGDFPEKLPVRMLGTQAYLDLPPKPGGEPKIDLGGFTAEMALDLTSIRPAARRPTREPRQKDEAKRDNTLQQELFEAAGGYTTQQKVGQVKGRKIST